MMSMKYRKKPVVIDAVLFEDNVECFKKLQELGLDPVRVGYDVKPPVLRIETLEGEMTASLGDYIIRGVNGEFYPCKPDIFDKTYELITNAEAKTPVLQRSKKRVCFDFDGVIHAYTSRWKGASVIPDPPVEGIKEVIQELRLDGWEVVVFTTRSETMAGTGAVIEYLKKHDMEVDIITALKLPAFVYVDDRAICFDGDTSGLVEQIKTFQPWMKKYQKGDKKNARNEHCQKD